jgi:hypothetical protein
MNPLTIIIDKGTLDLKKKMGMLQDENNEVEDWMPEEAFKVAHEFRSKCANQVS